MIYRQIYFTASEEIYVKSSEIEPKNFSIDTLFPKNYTIRYKYGLTKIV